MPTRGSDSDAPTKTAAPGAAVFFCARRKDLIFAFTATGSIVIRAPGGGCDRVQNQKGAATPKSSNSFGQFAPGRTWAIRRGIASGYSLKTAVLTTWDQGVLAEHGFDLTEQGIFRFSYPDFTPDKPITDVARHIEKMIYLLNEAQKRMEHISSIEDENSASI